MRRSALAVATALTCSAILLAGPVARPVRAAGDGKAEGKATGEDLFGLTKVAALHIEIPADEYQAMQPAMPAFGQGGLFLHRGRSGPAIERASGTCSAPRFPGCAGP